MITAHIPSGYVAFRASRMSEPLVLWACLIGAFFPDIDLLWFYFVDHRGFHHHRYWVHAPGFWLAISVLATPVLIKLRPTFRHAGIAFLATWFLHLLLDSIVGSIMWLWPFSDKLYQLAIVQPTHSHFILSFMAHWSFLLEILVWVIAIGLYLHRRLRNA